MRGKVPELLQNCRTKCCSLSVHTCYMWKQPLEGHVTEAEGGSHRHLPPRVGGDGPNCSGTNRGCINQTINQSGQWVKG